MIRLLVLGMLLPTLAGCFKYQQKPTARFGTRHLVALERGKVFARDTGKGPAVLLIHGFAGGHRHWAPIEPALVKAGFRTIVVDLPGNGRSDKYPGDYTTMGLGRTLVDVLDKLGVDKAHVVGHSWGTAVALAVAIQRPKRVLSLSLIGSWAYEDQLAPFIVWTRAPLLGEFLFWAYLDQFLDERMPLTFYDPDFPLAQPKYIELSSKVMHLPGWLAANLEIARGMRFEQMQRRYREIPHRTLLLHGRADLITRLPWARRLHAEIRDSRLVIIDNAAHTPQLEQPKKVLAALVPFLMGLEPNQAITSRAEPQPEAKPPAKVQSQQETSRGSL